MRCFDADDEYDRNEAERLGAKPWQMDLLKLNPSYVHWGPHEDYMCGDAEDKGWSGKILCDGWTNNEITLDELNEVVNFYFEIDRDHKKCEVCGGDGYHPDAHWVTKSFYQHSSPFKNEDWQSRQIEAMLVGFGSKKDALSKLNEPLRKATGPDKATLQKYGPAFQTFCSQMMQGDGYWGDKITEDEVAALAEHDRLYKWKKGEKMPTAAEVNAAQHGAGLNSHDAINQGILTEARLKRFGIPKTCEECHGHGQVFTAPEAHVNLILWLIHPRKGASRGVEIKHVQQADLPAIFKFLKEAADRNAQRFEKITYNESHEKENSGDRS